MPLSNFPRLVQSVQRNCHIADARHAREMTLCNYLLEMREFYRWEHEVPLARALPRQELGNWISEREALWDALQADDLERVPVDEHSYGAFEVGAINAALVPRGLVYGGGYGRFGKPHFFLAQLERHEQRQGLKLFVSGCEYARDLSAPPASLLEGAVFLRRDALRRWLWEKVEIWGVRKADGALKSALECYGFAADAEAALERIVEEESETLILHELGEAMAEPLLGAAWRNLIASLNGRRAEILARAVRDNLADCLSTLPRLIEREATCSIHFHFANFEGMRATLFPLLDQAYRSWRESGNLDHLRAAARAGSAHWHEAALRLLRLHQSDPAAAEEGIAARSENPATLVL
ncbi:MAG: hypothetical protein EPO19_00455 [Betaproteobacteria bacterium]|nr:MAG: hypothetical protein EPO19_00455 [Betaproteobacteria bacterium]